MAISALLTVCVRHTLYHISEQSVQNVSRDRDHQWLQEILEMKNGSSMASDITFLQAAIASDV